MPVSDDQGLALKYLPLAIPDLCQVLEPSYFCANLLAIAEQPPKDTLRDKGVFSLPVLSSRFTFFSDLINSALFKIPGTLFIRSTVLYSFGAKSIDQSLCALASYTFDIYAVTEFLISALCQLSQSKCEFDDVNFSK